MGPEAIVIREEPPEGPARRRVYHPTRVGYEAEVQLWRLATGGWWTTETALLADVSVSLPECER